jgi:hypothetical protein
MSNRGSEETTMKANCNKDTFLIKSNSAYKKIGATFDVNQEIGTGYCWVYEYMDLYSIIIYDFSFHKDQYLEMSLPDSYSFTYYWTDSMIRMHTFCYMLGYYCVNCDGMILI